MSIRRLFGNYNFWTLLSNLKKGTLVANRSWKISKVKSCVCVGGMCKGSSSPKSLTVKYGSTRFQAWIIAFDDS